jgi:predicted nucleic acid-binding protein
MPYVVVDTNVVSYVFKRDTRARSYHRYLTGQTLVISFMTLAELSAWALQYRWGANRQQAMTRHLGQYVVQHSNSSLCEKWAEVRTQARTKGRPIAIDDAWIAATALLHQIPLVTHNPGDFAGVDGLTIFTAAKP